MKLVRIRETVKLLSTNMIFTESNKETNFKEESNKLG
jgi:hypothetical protein